MLDGRRLRALDESQHDSGAAGLAPLACCGNDAPRWCVAYTQPQAERWADQNLRQLGYATYLPLIAVQRRDNAIRSLKHTVLVPLFPRYLFVANDSPTLWRPIREAPGVASVLTTGDRVQYAPQGVLATLQASEASRRTLMAPRTLWAAGDPCKLSRGALAGHQGVVLTTTPTHAVVALILLGGLRRVTIRLDALTRPAA